MFLCAECSCLFFDTELTDPTYCEDCAAMFMLLDEVQS